MRSAQCPICSNQSLLVWFKKDFQLYQFPMEVLEGQRLFSMDLMLYFCEECHHAFIHPTPDDVTQKSFYANDYSSYTSALKTEGLTASMNDPAYDFIIEQIRHRYNRKIRIAEIGGGDGYILTKLVDFAKERLLIEPNEAGCAIARQYGVPVMQTSFEKNISQTLHQKFDVVICRHVIEHTLNTVSFLSALQTLLSPDGILILETPDLAEMFDRVLVRVVSLQHLQLFSLKSLNKSLEKAGSLIIDNFQYLSTAAFIVCATKDDNGTQKNKVHSRPIDTAPVICANAKAFDEKLESNNSKLKKIIDKWKKECKKIWIWGAGSAAGELFNIYDQQRDDFIGYIDSDEKKTFMKFATSPALPIRTPAQAYEVGVDAILIASFSVSEIVSSIRDLNWRVEVADVYSHEVFTVGE